MIFSIVIILIIILDQWSKLLAVKFLSPIGTYPILKNVFHLSYAENTGAAFSIFLNKQTFLIIITLLFTIALIYYLIRKVYMKEFFWFNLSLSFIIGGAIGNLIDRIRLSYVIDFFDFRLINFAIFNVADCFVVIGTIMLSLVLLFSNIEI